MKEYKFTLANTDYTMKSGLIAKQADGSVVIESGDSVVLATATMGEAMEGASFFPLTVDFLDKFCSGGSIPHNRITRREGRPSTQAVLNARICDRPIRPLFPKGTTNPVQIVITPLSQDQTSDLGVLGMNAASMALTISGMPFEGPIGAVRIGLKDDQLVVNPDFNELNKLDLDLLVAGKLGAITMVESRANEISEDKMLEALALASKHIDELCQHQLEFAKEFDIETKEFTTSKLEDEKIDLINQAIDLNDLEFKVSSKKEFKAKFKEVLNKVLIKLESAIEQETVSKSDVRNILNKAFEKIMRKNILEKDSRIDNRSLTEIRNLQSWVGLFERTHGSGLFERGETQAITTMTLGGPQDALLIENYFEEEEKTYYHQYNFPAYSVGEARPNRGPSRRDIGHGNLAEKALLAVIPSQEQFPFTIRVTSEIVGCNGSSSMASVCGSTLSLMDGGVPLKAPVAGIAMGLVSNDDETQFKILSDIQGLEDFAGDMDFKVTGTRSGITALQMDIKLKGLKQEVLANALNQAKEGLNHILDHMNTVIDKPRTEVSKHAPIIATIQINPDKIKEVIGKGGETIQKLTAETNTEISIEQDGMVTICAKTKEGYDEAIRRISEITYEPQAGETFDAKVVRIENFGAFVEIMPGKQGLLHISKISPERINHPSDILKIGQILKVKLTEVDREGRYNFSHKEFFKKPAVTADQKEVQAPEQSQDSKKEQDKE